MRSDHLLSLSAALSGAVLLCAFPPYGIWPLAWIAFVPALILVEKRGMTSFAWLSFFVAALSFWLLATRYMWSSLFGQSFGSPIRLTVFSWVVAFLGASAWWLTFAIIHQFRKRWAISVIYSFPVVWMLCYEILNQTVRYACGFHASGICALSLSQADVTTIAQISDIAGSQLIVFLIASTNAAIAAVLLGQRRADVVAVGLLVLMAVLYGNYRLAGYRANAGPTILTSHSGTFDLGLQPDLLLGGETDYTVRLRGATCDALGNNEAFNATRDLARQAGVPAIVGYQITLLSSKRPIVLNSLAMASPDSRLDFHHKIYLAPVEITPTGYQAALGLGALRYTPGANPKPFKFRTRDGTDYTMAPCICYEGWLSEYYRKCACDSSFVAMVGNEGFDESRTGSDASLRLTKLRSIEMRVATVRNVRGGANGVVDACGRMRYADKVSADSGIVRVPIADSYSLYRAYGNMPLTLTLSGWSLTGIASRRKRDAKAENIDRAVT